MTAPESRTGGDMSRGPIIALAAAVGLTALSYWSVIDADFIVVDDDFYVYDNPMVSSGLSGDSIAWAFSESSQANWIPLTLLTYLIDAELFGIRPAGFHFTNLLLHLVGSSLCFFAFNALTKSAWRSVMLAAVFALHPVHVESVAWVSSRKDVLSGIFFFLALMAYARYAESKSTRHMLAVLIAFAGALMSKPVVMTLPFVFLLLYVWPLRRIDVRTGGRSLIACVVEKIPLFVVMIAFLGLTFVMQDRADAYGANIKYSLWERTQNAFVAYAQYVAKFFRPDDLAPMYPLPLEPYSLAAVAGSMLFVLGLTLLLFLYRVRCAPSLVGWLWFLGMLIPVAGFIQVGNQAYADRYTYLPYVGLSVAVIWPLAALADWTRVPRTVVAGLCAVTLSMLGFVTHQQAARWRDTETLFTHTLEVTKDNAFAHHTLGYVLAQRGDNDAAIEQYQQAIALVPGYFNAHVHLAQAYEAAGDPESAERHYLEALEYKPNDAIANNAYGLLLIRSRRFDRAITHLARALETYPDDPALNSNLGLALQDSGRHEEALPYLTRAAELRPGSWPYALNRAFSLEAAGRIDDAETVYRNAIQNGFSEAAIQERRRVLMPDSP